MCASRILFATRNHRLAAACLVAVSTCVAAAECAKPRITAQTTSDTDEWQRARELLAQGDEKGFEILKDMFQRASGNILKQKLIAVDLVRYREPSGEYDEFLEPYAVETIEAGVPYPLRVNAEGLYVRGELSDDFLRWCEANDIQKEVAAGRAMYEHPRYVRNLAETGDPRAYFVLIQALQSPNPRVMWNAGRGLAFIGDPRAIPLIIAAAEKEPTEPRRMVAASLLLFNDDDAHRACRASHRGR